MIDPQLPATLAERLAGYDDLVAGIEALKAEYAPLRFTHCSEDDLPVNARPVAEAEQFDIYLVAGGDGCLSLTNDPAIAAAVVIAEREEE